MREVTDIGFEQGGDVVHITWVDPDDIRVDGLVAVRQTIRIDGRSSRRFQDEVDGVQVAALHAIQEALGEWTSSPPAEVDRPRRERPLPESGDEDAARAQRQWEAIERNREAQAVRADHPSEGSGDQRPDGVG